MGSSYALPVLGATPRISSLLIKPASAVCNLDCSYCFYLDRAADPYKDLPGRRMSLEVRDRDISAFAGERDSNGSAEHGVAARDERHLAL